MSKPQSGSNRHEAEKSDGLKVRLLYASHRGQCGDVIKLTASVARALITSGDAEKAE